MNTPTLSLIKTSDLINHTAFQQPVLPTGTIYSIARTNTSTGVWGMHEDEHGNDWVSFDGLEAANLASKLEDSEQYTDIQIFTDSADDAI